MRYLKSFGTLTCGLGLVCLMASAPVRAQQRVVRDSTIAGQTIQIHQIYTPEIAKPQKPVLTPTLPRVDTTTPTFQYVVPQQTLSYTYHSVPIRPLALGKSAVAIPFQNYIKAGLGNLTSIYLDAGVGSLNGEDYTSTLHLSHLSQKGKLAHQHSSNTAFDAAGKYYTEKVTFDASLTVRHDRYGLFGFDQDQYEYGRSALNQAFTGARLRVGAVNSEENDPALVFHPQFTFGMYSDAFKARERSFDFLLPARFDFSERVRFSLALAGSLVQFKNSLATYSNNMFRISPAVDLTLKRTRLHLGLSPTFGKGGDVFLFPDISLESNVSDRLLVVAGWKGSLVQNTYESLSDKNPFLDNIYLPTQTRSTQVFAGFESGLGAHFTFGGTVSWRQWRDLALFINDYAENPDGKRFQVVYDDRVQALSLDAFAHYQIGRIVGLQIQGSWYNFYKTTTYEKAWLEPMLRLKGGIELRPIKKLQLQAGFDFWDGLYARTRDAEAVKLPAFFDLGASAAYDLMPRFSVFVQLNNILNNKYQRWYQYDNYGFNIIGGFRFKF